MPRVTGLARVANPADLNDRQLDRLIRRLALILVVGAVAFTAFYLFDRWRPTAPSIVDRELTALDQAVRDDPNDVASRGRLADVYVAAGRFQEAVAQYDAVLGTGKADRLGHYGRARARVGLGQLDGAAEDYRAVVELGKGGEMANVDPLLQSSYYGIGDIALRQGRPKDAIEPLLAALRIKRSDADALYLLGSAYVGAGEPEQAIEPLRKATAFVPIGWAEPYTTLAQAFTAAGEADEATWAGAMAALAVGDADTAEARLLAIRDGAAAVDAAVGLGLVAETRGDFARAREWYGRALELDPKSSAALLGSGRVGGPGTERSAEPSGEGSRP